ncbi:MAG: hypothetical protein CBB72_010980 [Muricauda sp. TMED12]|nr:MAG: hypothetical protein CBB72_010980 [Muricauda sp. TMED12]
MINDFFTLEVVEDINDENENKVGIDIITYRYLKLRNTKNLQDSNTYSVTVKHRIFVNGSGWKPNADYQSKGFTNYPIMLTVKSGILGISDTESKIFIKRIFPKTINATVEQSNNLSTGDSKSQTKEISSGSSSSNVNTFGINVTGGWFGDGPVATISLDYSHSWENSHSHGSSVSNANARDIQAASGDEMSVKDWSAYSSILNIDNSDTNYIGEVAQWNWGQTFPWNIFDYNEPSSGTDILLPQDVEARLLYSKEIADKQYENILLPPSELALFGLDFTMAAEWQVTFPSPLTSIEQLKFQHEVQIVRGNHQMTSSGPNSPASLVTLIKPGNLNTFQQTDPVDIGKYSLIPLLEGQRTGRGLGFQKNLFDIAPANPATEFKIRSRGNDLMVTGSGFGPSMSALFKKGYTGSGAILKIAFKVADLRTQYVLNLKHWIGSAGGSVVLECKINGNTTRINDLDMEGQGSSNNLSQLDLRNFDLKSPNFHDYLVLGWNEAVITILPQDSAVESEYVISALSIEG